MILLGNSSTTPRNATFGYLMQKKIYIHINTYECARVFTIRRVPEWKSLASEWKHNGMHLYNTTVFINKQEHLTIFSTLWTSKPLKR